MKIMTPRNISLDTLRKNLRMLWKTNKWVNFSELEEDLFLVEFGDGKIRRKSLTCALGVLRNNWCSYKSLKVS